MTTKAFKVDSFFPHRERERENEREKKAVYFKTIPGSSRSLSKGRGGPVGRVVVVLVPVYRITLCV